MQPPPHLRERPVVAAAEVAGAEELAMDANSEDPDRPRREFAAVVVGAVDVAGAPVEGSLVTLQPSPPRKRAE